MAALFPADSDPVELADWMEVEALGAADGDASFGDCERGLSLLGVPSVEQKALAAMEELRRRSGDAGEAYPFDVRFDSIRIRGGSSFVASDASPSRLAYLFCLALWRGRHDRSIGIRPGDRLLFERLALAAACGYLGGDGMVFGTSAAGDRSMASGFVERIEALCREFGEGEFRPQPLRAAKDGGVDVVAWKHFPDRRPGKLALMGGCATGDNWRAKLHETDPDIFWSQWMSVGRISPILRSFFMPGRVSNADGAESWDAFSRKAGILFDRCRIARFAHEGVGGDPDLLSRLHAAVRHLLGTVPRGEPLAAAPPSRSPRPRRR